MTLDKLRSYSASGDVAALKAFATEMVPTVRRAPQHGEGPEGLIHVGGVGGVIRRRRPISA